MKKLLSLIVAVAFALSFAAVVVAAEKPAAAPAAAPAKAEPMKAEPAKKAAPAKKVAKAKSKQVTGTIESLDAATGDFSVKGKKETVALKAGAKVKLAEFAVGDKVLVKYSEGTASSVKKVHEKKKAAPKAEKKAAAPKAEKKEAAPAAPATK